jgi:hypothetical protein
MTLDETLKLLHTKERESSYLFENALSIKRYRAKSNIQILRPSEAFFLPAVNAEARIKWGRIFIREIFQLSGITVDEDGPDEPMFLITIADKSHVTTDQPQQINLSRIKRTLGCGPKGLSYIGMIEPGYYNVIYDELGKQRKKARAFSGLGRYRGAACETSGKNKIPPYANYAWSVRCP